MLHQQNNNQNPVKKGWLFKRGNSCWTRWKLKWAVLYDHPYPALYIFDKRDHVDPKYIIRTEHIAVNDMSRNTNDLIDNVKEGAFVLTTRSRRFYFAPQNSKDGEEWMLCLKQYSNPTVNQLRFDRLNLHGARERTYSRAESVYSAYSVRSHASAIRSRASSRSSALQHYQPRMAIKDIAVQKESSSLSDFSSLKFLKTVLTREMIQKLFAEEEGRDVRGFFTELPSPAERWDEIYQQAVERFDNAQDGLKLFEIVGRFQEISKQLCVNIIDKYHHQDPKDEEVFLVGNIFLQFAAEYEEETDDEYESLMMEIKSGNELRSISYFNRKQSAIRTALMVLIDYKGFRMIACPIMPINSNSLIPSESFKKVYSPLGTNKIVQINESSSIQVPEVAEIHRSGHEFYALSLGDSLPVDTIHGSEVCKFRPELLDAHQSSSDKDKPLAKFLTEKVIPKFVNQLDAVEKLPLDGTMLSAYMHQAGINIRYLPKIYELSKLPHVKQLCLVEIIARASKTFYKEKIRKTILKFRKLGADEINDELVKITTKTFNSILGGNSLRKFLVEKLEDIIDTKYRYKIDDSAVSTIHKPQLFLALQSQCGVQFLESIDYDFSLDKPIHVNDFVKFEATCKLPQFSLPENVMQAFSEVDKEDYACSKEILLKGSKNITKDASGKLSVLARKLIQEQKFTPAMSIARVAYKSATKNHVISVVVRAAYIEAQWLNQTGSMNIDRSLDEFSLCTEVAQFHLGPAHPILIAFSDKITHLMAVIDDPSAAIAYMKKSLEASVHTLGGGHPIVAGYHTKLGYLYLSSLRSEEAITEFKQALATFEKTKPGDEAVAENHFVLAEAYSDIGNMEGALFHSMKAVEIREKNFGESHAKTVDSYQQYGKFVSLGYSEYEGVITTRIKEEILHGLRCYEKVFKYMKTKRIETSPYGNSDERKDVLLSLTKTIVGLKLKLIPGQHRQLLRYIREKKQVYDNEFAQSSLLKLLHLTPSVYLEDIFQRLDADKTASKELAVVIQIAESVKSSLNNKK